MRVVKLFLLFGGGRGVGLLNELRVCKQSFRVFLVVLLGFEGCFKTF